MKKQVKKILLLVILIITLSAIVANAADSNLQLDRTTGTLTINKSVDGTVFDIYQVSDIETSKAIPTGSTAFKTGTVASGKAVFEDLPLGRYLVVEASTPEGLTGKVANFLVDIPMTEPGTDTDTLVYDVDVSPKDNTTYGTVTLTNYGVVSVGGNSINNSPLEGSKFKLQQEINDVWTDITNLTLITDSNGQIVVEGLEEGKYRFIQQSVNNGYILDNGGTYGFSVSSDSSGNTVVSPSEKTVINEKPQITKEITSTLVEDEGGKGSAKIGDVVTYKIVVEIPNPIADSNTFKITDIIPEGLTLDTSTINIKYDINIPRSIIEETEVHSVDFDEATRNLTIICNTSNMIVNYDTMTITYNATVNENISASSIGNINTATLEYSTVVKEDYEGNQNTDTTNTISDIATVYTGGFWIEKRAESTTGELLSGAVFKLAATEAEAKAGTYLTDAEGNEIAITTDEDGKASYKGLTYGTYYLVETKAPTYVDESTGATKSYNLLRKPQPVTINDETYEAPIPTGIIVNKKGLELPGTGSIGTLMLTVMGIVIILVGTNVAKKKARH